MNDNEFCHITTENTLESVDVLKAHFKDTVFGRHSHSEFVISLVEQGAKKFHHKGMTHIAKKGAISIVSPDELHDGEKG